jgi:hypothetical protein
MTTLMTTTRTALGGALALALAPAFWPSDAAAHTCDAPFTTDLVTGTGIDVGQVEVCNDDTMLTVTYETIFPWCVLKTDLHVARDLAGIPRIRLLGTPNFLRFDYGDEYDPCVGTDSFNIPLQDIADGVIPGETVMIAARAVVEGEGEDGTHPRCLLGDKCVAWGEGPRFRPRLPAMHFTYEVQESFLCGGDTSKCVFVTSTLHDGNLGGLAGADQICQDLAESEGSLAAPGTYMAWLSTPAPGNLPADRLTHATVPYKLVSGETVANDFADFTTCDAQGQNCLQHPIDKAENGGDVEDSSFSGNVWTDTHESGASAAPFISSPPGTACGGWTLTVGEPFGAAVGRTSAASAFWTFSGLQDCSLSNRLYCFQQ